MFISFNPQSAPAHRSLDPSTASWGATMAALPKGRSVRWAVSGATGWTGTPDSPARPTPSGVDPNLGVWVSLHHLQTTILPCMLHQKCLCKRNSDSNRFLISIGVYSNEMCSDFTHKVFGMYIYTCCLCGHFGSHPDRNPLGDTGSQFSLSLIHFTYILSKGIHLPQPQVCFFFVFICHVFIQSLVVFSSRVKLDFFIWLFNLHYFPW